MGLLLKLKTVLVGLVALVASTAGLLAVTAAEPETKSGAKSQDGLDPENLPAEMSMTLEQLLNDSEGVAPDVDAKRCLSGVRRYSSEVLDNQHLLFRSTTGRRAWLNRMRSECIGLRPGMILVMEPSGSRLCQLDSVYGVAGAALAGFESARCRLGMFEPITREHADALVETFKIRSKEMAESRRAERRSTRAQRKRRRRAAREAKERERSTSN